MRYLLLFLALAAIGCATSTAQEPVDADTPQILVFSKTAGYRHESIEPGQDAFRRLADEHGFDVSFSEDASFFQDDSLRQVHVVVFLSTTMDVLDEAQQQAFERFIQAGGEFVGIHAASDTEYDWPWYGRLVGGYFDGHPNNPNVREGIISIADANHAATRDLPNPWTRNDEWYDFRDLNPDLNILLTIDERTYKTLEENPSAEPHPLAWYHEYDGGRAFYTNLGHTSETFSEPLFLKHLWGGLQYAIGEGALPDYSRLP